MRRETLTNIGSELTMCTIMTVDKKRFTEETVKTIHDDSCFNYDGWCLVLVNEYGETISNLRTMEIAPIIAMLKTVEWSRMFLHSRAATGVSDVCLNNVHGWGSNNYIYMHNGFIRHRNTANLSVDSKMIGKWLTYGLDICLSQLQKQEYANVFIIDTLSADYVVSRSKTNELYTDGDGNYSTTPFDSVCILVPKNTVADHSMQIEKRPVEDRYLNSLDEYYEYIDRYNGGNDLDVEVDLVDEISLASVNFAGGKK